MQKCLESDLSKSFLKRVQALSRLRLQKQFFFWESFSLSVMVPLFCLYWLIQHSSSRKTLRGLLASKEAFRLQCWESGAGQEVALYAEPPSSSLPQVETGGLNAGAVAGTTPPPPHCAVGQAQSNPGPITCFLKRRDCEEDGCGLTPTHARVTSAGEQGTGSGCLADCKPRTAPILARTFARACAPLPLPLPTSAEWQTLVGK